VTLAETPVEVTGTTANLTIELPGKGTSVLLFTKDPGAAPDQAAGLRAEKYRSLSGQLDEVLLRWDSGSRM
jgi:hypothetical protein